MESNKSIFSRIRNWINRCLDNKAFIISLSILFICFWVSVIWKAEQPVICTDISEYGYYTGTGANDFVRDYIHSIFPEKIEDTFSDIKYVYKAAGQSAYDFEAYLEFSIKDPDAFRCYVENIAPEYEWEPFRFDADFQISLIENYLHIHEDRKADPESDFYYPIESAKIKAILYNPETNTIIFWALGVYDGDAISTNFLNTFFERFDIDPILYLKTADTEVDYDPYAVE